MAASLGKDAPIDLPRLLETRLLVQANSGAGKSWLLRRLLEQTAGLVQQLVIDPEGEFSTLREKFDYVICAPHDADAVATPQTAKLLARRLLETGVSAVLDIYDLKPHERVAFVKLFLNALVNAPKHLWHPSLVVLDEAHVYAPEKGSADSRDSVIDIATRGRKRGFCLIPATQRLAKLHKDVAAECINKAIGRTGLDIDVRRAADELGMTHKDAREALILPAGDFYVFGPALSDTVKRIRVGPVQTTHPKAGQRMMKAPPAPSAAIKAKLAELADLPQEAEQEARTMADLQRENARLARELRAAEKRTGPPVAAGPSQAEIDRRIRQAVAARDRETAAAFNAAIAHSTKLERTLAQIAKLAGVEPGSPRPIQALPAAKPTPAAAARPAPPRNPGRGNGIDVGDVQLRKGARRILAELSARIPAGYTRAQVGGLTKFAHTGGTFTTYIGDLKRAGFIEEREGQVFATEEGVEFLGDRVPSAPTTHDEAMALWRKALRAGAYRMLETVVAAGGDGMGRDELADQVGMVMTGGTFGTYVGDLKRNGLVTEQGGILRANDILFP